MKISNKLIAVIILLVILGIIFFSFAQLQPTQTTPNSQETPQTEEKNLETYEEDFEAIDEALNNIEQ